MTSAVSLTEVTKLFGRFAALREVTAEFSAGKLCAIFGENGAGKSTLLRIVAGLARPTRGSVTLGLGPIKQTPQGQNTLNDRDSRLAVLQKIGYMAHASMLYDEMSAMENLQYFAKLFGIRHHGDANARGAATMERVGLDPKLDRRVSDYSQGMRQRLSLARAILHDPELLLLDEPFSNLDVNGAREIAALLGKLRDAGKTVLVVTHQPGHLELVADESLCLSHGQIAGRSAGVSAAATLETAQ